MANSLVLIGGETNSCRPLSDGHVKTYQFSSDLDSLTQKHSSIFVR